MITIDDINKLLFKKINDLEKEGYTFVKIQPCFREYIVFKEYETNEWKYMEGRLDIPQQIAIKDDFEYVFTPYLSIKENEIFFNESKYIYNPNKNKNTECCCDIVDKLDKEVK